MAHSNHVLARSADFINREGFEWLMRPISGYRYYKAKYPPYIAQLRYGLRMMLTVLGTVIPVLPALYILARLAVVADFQSNPLKPVVMAGVLGGFAALIATVGPKAIAHALPLLGIAAPAALIGAAVLTLGCALALYLAKQAVRGFNFHRSKGLTTTPKHNYPQPVKGEFNARLMAFHAYTRDKHFEMKTTMQNEPHSFNVHANGQLNGKPPISNINSAEDTIELGKQTLARLEDMIGKHHRQEELKEEFNAFFDDAASTGSGLYSQWKAAAKATAPWFTFTEDEQAQGKIMLDQKTSKLMISP